MPRIWEWCCWFGRKLMGLEPALVILITFQIGFWITRHIRTNAKSWIVKDVAVHHFIWALGFLTLLLVAREYFHGKYAKFIFRCLFAGLLGIIYDEAGMWIHLTPNDGLSMLGFWVVTIGLVIIIIARFFYRSLKETELGNDELPHWLSKDSTG